MTVSQKHMFPFKMLIYGNRRLTGGGTMIDLEFRGE